MKSTVDLVIIALYLLGTVAFGCSFFFRKGKEGDGAK